MVEAVMGFEPQAISAGSVSQSQGTVVFSNSNGVTFGMNGSTVTASVATVGSFVASAFPVGQPVNNQGFVNGSLSFINFDLPFYMTASRVNFFSNVGVTSGGGGSATVSHLAGLYTMSGSTASLLAEGSLT